MYILLDTQPETQNKELPVVLRQINLPLSSAVVICGANLDL